MPPSPPLSPAAIWLGTWSRPPDRPSQVALAAAVALVAIALVPGGPAWLAAVLEFASVTDPSRRRRFLTVASFVAAFLSLGYVALYLRGGPRAPEAASYWLQGRAFSHGGLTWVPPEPSASFRARLLWFVAPDRLAGAFPPGFALLLAPAFLVGAPMLVGPLLAAAVVVCTWFLAREIAMADGAAPDRAETIGRIAAGLSLVCAALRYHTADVLPYASVAAAVAASLAFALRAIRVGEGRLFGLVGLLVGFLVATLPAAAFPAGALAAGLAVGARSPSWRTSRALTWAVVCGLPGALLVLAAHHATTGRAFASATSAYFATIGPPRAPGASPVAAAVDVLRLVTLRLRAHLLDVANLEPLALLALVPVLGKGAAARNRTAALAALLVAGYLVVCAPLAALATPAAASASPAIGAPLLMGVVPVEHALMALGLVALVSRVRGELGPAIAGLLAASLAGFAVHASYEHMRMAISGYGRPRYEPDFPREANITHGLVFFDDDEGYQLANDPGMLASHGMLAVRMRGDDHDRLLYDLLGHPAAHRYNLSVAGPAVVPWTPPGSGTETWRFEAESDFPPFGVSAGRADAVEAKDMPSPCASDGRVLLLTPTGPTGGGEATAILELPVPRPPAVSTERRNWSVTPRVLQRAPGLGQRPGGSGTLSLVVGPTPNTTAAPLAEWTWSDPGAAVPSPATQAMQAVPTCLDLPAKAVELVGDAKPVRAWLVLRAAGGPVALDKTTLHAGPR
jgi:hypothetical protein